MSELFECSSVIRYLITHSVGLNHVKFYNITTTEILSYDPFSVGYIDFISAENNSLNINLKCTTTSHKQIQKKFHQNIK